MDKKKKQPDSIEDLKEQLHRTNQTVVDTLQELKLTKEDRDELIRENKSLEKQVKLLETGSATGTESLRKEMQKMKTKIGEQREHLLGKAVETERLKGQLQDAEKRASEAETYLGSDELAKRCRDQVNLRDDKIEELKNEITKYEKFLMEKNEQLQQYEINGERSYYENRELGGKVNALQKQLDEARDHAKEQLDEAYGRVNDHMVRVNQLEKGKKEAYQKYKQTVEHYENNIRTLEGKTKTLALERDDLRDRFSKMRGQKFTDNNADIADLSDPNRAIKLSEKFGLLYDDEWTDAFQDLTNKMKAKETDAIQFLLSILQECNQFCQKIADGQIDSLKNVLLHPVDQDPYKSVQVSKDRPRVASKEDRLLKELRRQVGNTIGNEIKLHFLMELTKDQKQQKWMGAAKPYVEKCAEICWLMVLHDPVLYMDMNVKTGDRLDPNIYSAYSSSGNKIEYLVWPPLYNGKGGGLLSKGVAGTQRTVKK